ncbi:MAG: YedE-related selenium metabolism membrane protein [Proteobacteria bacterium]|nr:YedE-related selenium metabolism membrane protein [Pseudomonadota bacterium]MBU1739040.1 YedE-related selenium metabolism membrane protein [Pseudomonadota bacterium]
MHKGWFVLMGAAIGVGALTLSYYGNPANTGLCVSCFMENTAGALGLHDNIRMQYLRPELIGFVLGAFMLSLYRKEFVPSGGSSPLIRFLIGFFLIIGCTIFIGCPVKMVLRLTSGDLGALIGLVGLIAGIYIGLEFVENGFQLGEPSPQPRSNSLIIPLFMAFLLVLLIIEPSFVYKSAKGSGALRAPMLLSLGIGLVIGGLAQYTQFCITGGIARIFLWGPREVLNCPRSTGLLISLGSFFVFATVASILTGQFNPGLQGQPSSNDSYGWAFLGMMMVGFGSILIRGCPMRQLIASAQGDNDAGAAVMGMFAGAAMAQNWGLAGTPAGTPVAGQVAVLTGLLLMIVIGMMNRRRGYGIAREYQVGLD